MVGNGTGTVTPQNAGGEEVPTRAKAFLCTSYAFAAWAWRSWEFIVALVLIELYPNSLLMVSAYGLLDNLSRVLLGPVVGGYIDRHERLTGARAMLRLQNQCIGGSALAALVLLWPGSPVQHVKAAYWPLMWLLMLLGAASSAGSTGVSITVEREAVKALCGTDTAALARLNSVMRAIDLSALLLAPLVAGLVMTAAGRGGGDDGRGPFVAVVAMAGYCGAAYVPELVLLGAAFRAAPVLGLPKATHGSGAAERAAAVEDAEDADERTGLLAAYTDEADEADADKGDGGFNGASEPSGSRGGQGLPISTTAQSGGGSRAAAGGAQEELRRKHDGPAEPAALACVSGRRLLESGPSLTKPLVQGGDESESPGASTPAGRRSEAGSSRAGLLDGEPPSAGPSRNLSTRPSFLNVRSGDDTAAATPGGAFGGKFSTASSMTALADEAPGTAMPRAAAAAPGIGSMQRRGPAAAPSRRSLDLTAPLRSVAHHWRAYSDSWRVYVRQPVLLLCLALALLYMTVLSLGFLMTSFLKWSGLTEAEVSGYRGIGALTGLAATLIFPPLSARAGLRACAVVGISWQLACLAAGVLPVVLLEAKAAGSSTSTRPSVAQLRMMVAGLVSSRTGLWLYDLAVTQLIQEDVRQDQLGTVYGVQSSLQAGFEMLSFVAGLVSPDPARFHWLMLGSVCSVAVACALVWGHVCTSRRRERSGAVPLGEA